MLNKLKNLFKAPHCPNNHNTSPRRDENFIKCIEDLTVAEKHIIKNFLALMGTVGEDIMVHRPMMVCLSHDLNFRELWKIVREQSHIYYPIYEENLDDIKGYISVYDLAKLIIDESTEPLSTIIKPILFIPASIPVIDILMKMQYAKAPIVIMVDEHGGTDGLLCIEDIIDKALNSPQDTDENSDEEFYFERINETTIIVEGQYLLKDLVDETGLNLTKDEQAEELDTVNGLIQYLVGRVPDRSEIITHGDKYEFEILESSPRAVLKVKITCHKG